MTSIAYDMPSLVVLAGPSGAGKSVFAARLFPASMVVSSDQCREMLSDDASNQAVSAQAFALVNYIARERLTLGYPVVIDSTALVARDRANLLQVAAECGVPTHLLLITSTHDECFAGNRKRDRQVPEKIIDRHLARLKNMLVDIEKGKLEREGFDSVTVLDRGQADAVESVKFVTSTASKIDVIGDIHGCASELQQLLAMLGYQEENGAFQHADGRLAAFVGDITDRGPASIASLELVGRMVARGSAKIAALGNHDWKLYRAAVEGRAVQTTNGLQGTIDEIEALDSGRQGAVINLIDELFRHAPSYSSFDEDRLVVTHGAMRRGLVGRRMNHRRDALSSLCLYGETSGETHADGKPVRLYDWVESWSDPAQTVIFGHDVVGMEPRRTGPYNNVIGIDTGCAFGGRLTAYRYPEAEIVQVAAQGIAISHEALEKVPGL